MNYFSADYAIPDVKITHGYYGDVGGLAAHDNDIFVIVVSIDLHGNLVASHRELNSTTITDMNSRTPTDIAKWRRCAGSCGKCSITSTSKSLRTTKPDRMIEWAHNVIDVAEDLLHDSRGLPQNYKFNCNITASATHFILPSNAGEYLGSRQHQEQLIHHAVNVIYRSLKCYSDERVLLSRSREETLAMLSLCDIDDFKQCMMNQLWFPVVHAAIDQINITTTTVR